MGEPATKITKSIGRIAVCSIGGVITIFGFMLCLGALLELPDDILKNVILFFAGVLVLSIGLYLCFLVIKPMQYFVKSQKMSGEEKAIEFTKKYLRNSRKIGIIVGVIFLIANTSLLIWVIMDEVELIEKLSIENMKLIGLVHLTIIGYMVAASIGFFFTVLDNEITGHKRNKHKLTLNMWERIGELENEVRELKSGLKSENQE